MSVDVKRSVERLLSADDAAELLGVSRRTIFNWTASGDLVVVELGTRRLYDPLDLRKFIDSRKVKAVPK